MPRLSWRKQKVELIYDDVKMVRGADARVYKDNLGKSIVIRRPLPLLVPLELTNIVHNDNKTNEPVDKRLTRLASLNADLMRQLSL